MSDPIQSPVPKIYTPMPPTPEPKPASKSAAPKQPAVDSDFVPSGPPLKLPTAAASGLPKGVTSADVSTWPMPVLEREALALQAKLAKDPKSVSAAEKNKLLSIEAEITKRQDAAPKLPEPSHPKTGVQLCKRTVDIAVIEYTGLKHHWLKTSKREAGMGPATGGVPGHAGGNNGSLLGPTTWNDHTGESEGVGATCEDLPDVDEDCVDSMALGTKTGRWTPGINDCHTVTQDVIDKCKKKPSPTEATDAADAGVK
jgi:hypothetical protein